MLKVLAEIGAETTPQMLVLNKLDALGESDRAQDLPTLTHRLLGETARQNDTEAVLVSARTGEGMDELLEKIDRQLVRDPVTRHCFRLPLGNGRALHLLHERGAVISQNYSDNHCEVVADVPTSIYGKLQEFAADQT